MKDAGAEGIDAAPILVLSPGKVGRSPRAVSTAGSSLRTPDKRAEERPEAPLAPQMGGAAPPLRAPLSPQAAWEEDAAFNLRPPGV